MLIVPLVAVPSQTLTIQLSNQPCTINIYQLSTGLFADLFVNDSPIITSVIGQDRNRIVRDLYLGFIGDLAFFDTQGTDDPLWTGLGARWILGYLTAADLTTLGLIG